MTAGPASAERPGLFARIGWTSLGLVSIGVGSVGIIVPGLPTTVFFIVAAWAFSKSNPRLEAWVLGLPRVGPLVQDYRAGLGMPRRAKITAVTMIVLFVGLSAWLVDSWLFRTVLALAAMIGIAVVLLSVPTKRPAVAQQTDR